ncbi:MAG: hypothetical protein JXB46_10185 [Candidatus Eisenbacteria bacterium]|nr:hypothetical protein [Candidatus Eisenbacteria bacterium]
MKRLGGHGCLCTVLSLLLWAYLCCPALAKHVALSAADVGSIQNPSVETDTRLLLRFQLPDDLTRDGTVDLAVVEIEAAVVCQDTAEALTIYAFHTIREWNVESIEWDEQWRQLSEISNVRNYRAWPATPGESSVIRFDVTDFVSACLSRDRGNVGIMAAIGGYEVGAFSPHCVNGAGADLPELELWYTPVRRISDTPD